MTLLLYNWVSIEVLIVYSEYFVDIDNGRRQQASSPPMIHYALRMDFPIHTRNRW